MTEQYIYIVFGEEGDYSDYRAWNVAAYNDKEAAEHHCQKANEWADELTRKMGYGPPIDPKERMRWYELSEKERDEATTNPYDRITHRYEIPKYTVQEIPVGWRYPEPVIPVYNDV